LSRNTKDTKLSYDVNPKSLSHMVLEWYQDVTDTKTELPQLIHTIAILALARKN